MKIYRIDPAGDIRPFNDNESVLNSAKSYTDAAIAEVKKSTFNIDIIESGETTTTAALEAKIPADKKKQGNIFVAKILSGAIVDGVTWEHGGEFLAEVGADDTTITWKESKDDKQGLTSTLDITDGTEALTGLALASLKLTVDTHGTRLGTAESNITANGTSISNESVARTAADVALQSGVDANASAISQEVTNRTAADVALQSGVDANASAISQEVTNRTAADVALQSGVDANASAISQEVTDRTAADVALQSGVDANASAISQEVTNRTAADVALQSGVDANASAISQEVTDRTAADVALQSGVDANASAISQEVTN